MRRVLWVFCVSLLLGMLAGCRAAGAKSAPTPGAPVHFAPALLDFLREVHTRWPDKETALCLLGEKQGRTLHVTGVRATTIHAADLELVDMESCPAGTLGVYHNHPDATVGAQCEFSSLDLLYYEWRRRTVDLISCSEGRFAYRARLSDGTSRAGLLP